MAEYVFQVSPDTFTVESDTLTGAYEKAFDAYRERLKRTLSLTLVKHNDPDLESVGEYHAAGVE